VRNILSLTSLIVFVGIALLLWFAIGNRLLLGTNDEGIYLDAAQRILHGQKPYVDFFGYMAPGSFWVEALSLRLFGETVAAGRLPVPGRSPVATRPARCGSAAVPAPA